MRAVLASFALAICAAPARGGLDTTGELALGHVDRMHSRLSQGVDDTAHWIDNFFGIARADDEANGSRVRVRTALEFAEGGALDLTMRVRAKLVLPRLNHRLRLIVGTDEDDAVTHDLNAVNSLHQIIEDADRTQYATALSLVIAESRKWNSYVSTGLRYHSRPSPYVRVKTRREFDFEPALLRLSQRFTRYEDIGFESRSTIDLERLAGELNFLRASSEAVWREDRQGLELTQAGEVARQFDSHRAASLRVSMTSLTSPSAVVDRYDVSLRFRRRLREQWCFAEIVPRATFPNDRDFRFTPSIVLALELAFGDS